MDRKKAWNSAFENYIRSLDAQKPVIWLGDLNVAPTALGTDKPLLCSFETNISTPSRHQTVKAKLQQICWSHRN